MLLLYGMPNNAVKFIVHDNCCLLKILQGSVNETVNMNIYGQII